MFSHTASWGRIARIVAAAIVITAVALGVPPVHADDTATNTDVPSIAVKYSDLNLATEEGSRVLYRRLEAAAGKVCPQIGYVTELRQNRETRQCIAASVKRAAKQIQSAQFAKVVADSKLR
jgi:UrcA family protein